MRGIKTKTFAIFLIGLFLSQPLVAAADDVFNPSLLIADERFSDIGTLGGPEGIQKFLESKGSVLGNTSAAFLQKLREPGDQTLKSNGF
jgi:hypothetical protein